MDFPTARIIPKLSRHSILVLGCIFFTLDFSIFVISTNMMVVIISLLLIIFPTVFGALYAAGSVLLSDWLKEEN